MNILFITYEVAEKGGNFIRCFSLAKPLVRQGHRITIITSNQQRQLRTKSYIKNGVSIIEIGCLLPFRLRHNGTSPFQVLFRTIHVLKNHYDIVHGFGHRPSVVFPALIHRLVHNRPYFADWCDLWGRGGLADCRKKIAGKVMGLLDDQFEKFSYKTCDYLTVISKDLYHKAIIIRKSKTAILLLPVGCDTTSVHCYTKITSRRKLRLSVEIPLIVFLGNAPYDEEFMANSFCRLTKMIPTVKMLFIGSQMIKFNQIIADNHLSDRVIHYGFVPHDQIDKILSCGDVMWLPYSDCELNRGRYPNKIGDYLSAGRPTVTNPTGDLKDLFTKYDIGVLAKENPKDFAKKTEYLLNNPRLSTSIGRNARKVAIKYLSWLAISKQLANFYQSSRLRH